MFWLFNAGKRFRCAREKKQQCRSTGFTPAFYYPFWSFFEEILSLRRYVNEQLENVKKSQYDNKQSAKCDHSTRNELQQLREENRSKTEIIKLLSENISPGNNEVKQVLPHKENTVSESSQKHSFKANKRFGNQKTGNNLVLQNRFKTLDVVSSFTAHELSNCRENLNISNPSNNANNSSHDSFSNKLNSIRWRPQVVINQNPENNNNYQKSKFVPGDKLSSESGKHHSSTPNNNNIVSFGGSI